MDEIRVVIPGDPFGKQRARIGGHQYEWHSKTGKKHLVKKMYTPPETEEYEAKVGHVVQEMLANGFELWNCPVELNIVAFYQIPFSWSQKRKDEAAKETLYCTKKPDFDNISKIIADSLNKVLWQDDARVCKHSIVKLYSNTPRVEFVAKKIGKFIDT